MPHSTRNLFRLPLALLATASLFVACNSKPSGQDAMLLPESLAGIVQSAGTQFQALAFTDRHAAETAFGFDIRHAGLLPIRISINNLKGDKLKIIPRQTFLVDLNGQAWPLLASSQAFNRLQKAGVQSKASPAITATDNFASLTGFALDMMASQQSSTDANAYARPDEHTNATLGGQTLRNPGIPAGKFASGVLYFPGRDEAHSAKELRLCFEQEGRLKFLSLPLQASAINSPSQ